MHAPTYIHYRFVTAMPNGAVFIAFSFVLRAVEGIGTAMYSTASYVLLTQLFSEQKGMIVVSQLGFVPGARMTSFTAFTLLKGTEPFLQIKLNS